MVHTPGTKDIGLKLPLDLGNTKCFKRTGIRDARIIHDHVKTAALLDDSVNRLLDGRIIGDIQAHHVQRQVFLLRQGTQLRYRLRILPTRIAHPRKDMRSLSCQRLDNQTPKTTIATCDQDRLSYRAHHLLLTSREK